MHRTLLSIAQIFAMLAFAFLNISPAGAALKHRYSFTADASDSVGGANGAVLDAGTTTNAVFAGGALDLTANVGNPSDNVTEDAYVDLPNGIVSALGSKGTFETWVSVAENRNWAEIYSFGQSRIDTGGENLSVGFGKYLTLIPDTGDGGNTFRLEAIRFPDGSPAFAPFGTTNVSAANNATLSTGTLHHVVSVIDSTDTMGGVNPNGTMRNYLDGVLLGASGLHTGFTLGGMPDLNNWLGCSQWPDPLFDGSYLRPRLECRGSCTQQYARPESTRAGTGAAGAGRAGPANLMDRYAPSPRAVAM